MGTTITTPQAGGNPIYCKIAQNYDVTPMMHPETELRFISPEIGHGVFATKFLPQGTITWTGDPLDQRLSQQALDDLPALCRSAVLKFSYVDPQGLYVLCWDHGKFVNHSCEPNCLSAGYEFEFAIRDIAPGEQLTDDYGMMNLPVALACKCGAPTCRRGIGAGDFENLTAHWDSLVSRAFHFIDKVPQPLTPLVKDWKQVEQALVTGEILSSKMHALTARC